jgi:peptidoglycan/xylan/chitin deacetylase (PgdA/CDA1 family)
MSGRQFEAMSKLRVPTSQLPPSCSILNFHGIGQPSRTLEPGEERYWITADFFRKCLDRVVAFNLRKAGELHITFDDGNVSDYEIALNEITERGLDATFFIVSHRIDCKGSLTKTMLRSLHQSGMAIGTHGRRHNDWRLMPTDELQLELRESKATLEDIISSPVIQAAIPFGSYDNRVLNTLRREGFQSVYSSDRGPCRKDRWLRPRTCITQHMNIQDIEAQIRQDKKRTSQIMQELRLIKRRYLME